MIRALQPKSPFFWADEPALGEWYPGRGEVHQLESLPRYVREFLADACEECPSFLKGYLIPTLGEFNSNELILNDLSNAISDLEISKLGLGDFGNLGKSWFRRVEKAVSHVAKRATKEVERVYRKEGDVIVGAIGAVLAPFTGGASLAAASLITGAHKMYQTKKAAEVAKKQSNQQSGALANQAAASEAQTSQQVDTFFSQNQPWFASHGVTQTQWSGMTLQQKLDMINSGATGAPVGSPTAPGASTAAATVPDASASAAAPDSGGGSSSDSSGGGGAPYAAQPSGPQASAPAAPAVASDGMSSMILPAAIIAGAVLFASGGGSSRRTRRNPGKTRRPGLGRGRRSRSRRRW